MVTENLVYDYALPHHDEMSSSNDSGISTPESSRTSSPGKNQPLSRRQRKNRTRLQREQQQDSRNMKMSTSRRRKLSKDESEKSNSSESGIGSQDSLKTDEVQQESSSLNEDEISDSSDSKEAEVEENKVAPQSGISNVYSGTFSHKYCEKVCLVRTHHLSHLDDVGILDKLKTYVLTEEQLIRNVFPIVYKPEKTVDDRLHKTSHKQKDIFCNLYMKSNEVYFKNWKPSRKNKNNLPAGDQDNSSDDEESLAPGIIAVRQYHMGFVSHFIIRANQTCISCDKQCQRCNRTINYDADRYPCHYHPETVVSRTEKICLSCGASSSSRGCMVNSYHVWSGSLPGLNGPCPGFVSTRAKERMRSPIESVYSLDCEMCYTVNGLELAHVTVVDLHGKIVYSEYVFTAQEIIDYNTRFSGITQRNYRPTKHIHDVQKDLCSLIDEETILIGHGLENDLRALKLVHNRLIDTSLLFANEKKRTSLKNLAQFRLGKTIQYPCHNAAEDARVTLELVLRYIQVRTHC